ncbi:MAG: DUF4352 domain-containing protein [Clostridiales bacterium]|nr:DUF4352 domain-containing protein [Clostridiales bacterium]
MKTRTKLLAGLLGMVMALSMTGCTGGDDAGDSSQESSNSSVRDADSEGLLDDLGNAINAQGRDYGEIYTIGQDDVMKSTFFDLKINSVSTADELNGYVPNEETDMFLILNVTVKNTFKSSDYAPIPMYYSDFQLTYDGLEEPWFPESKFTDGQFEDEYELEYDKSATGDVVFVVAKDAQNAKFMYVEYWDDDFVGNTYEMTLNPWA